MASTNRWVVPCNGETRNNTPSLLISEPLFGFPTDANAAQQSKPVKYDFLNNENVGIFVFLLAVMPAIAQTSRMKSAKRPFGSPIVPVLFLNLEADMRRNRGTR